MLLRRYTDIPTQNVMWEPILLKDPMNNTVSVVWQPEVGYPARPPFDPPEAYPELGAGEALDSSNHVYPMVREALRLLGMDAGRFGSTEWNPLGELISPGNTVVIKPNLCKHEHHLGEQGVIASITHGSVIRPIIDYCRIALQGNGKIIICDTPFEHTDFAKVIKISGIGQMIEHLNTDRDYGIQLIDLREYETEFRTGGNVVQQKLPGDPLGYVTVNLGNESGFAGLDSRPQNYHTLADHTVNHYEPLTRETGAPNKHHQPGLHEYKVARTVLSADVLISIPKLKTHGKAGVTLNLKNMIGIVAGKTYMPHHRPGPPPGGDAFPSVPPIAYVRNRRFRKRVGDAYFRLGRLLGRAGSEKLANAVRKTVLDTFWPASRKGIIEWGDWSGNDTIWRTVIDLNSVALYADAIGKMHDSQQRRYFSIVDGIVGQEGQGPTAGEPVISSVLVAGLSPRSVDATASSIMGFDPTRLKVVSGETANKTHYLGESRIDLIKINTNGHTIPRFNFRTPIGWNGQMEAGVLETVQNEAG